MHISCIIFAPFVGAYFYLLTYCVSVNAFFDAVDLYECFRYKFSQNDGRRRIFSFSRKIYKSALALISGSLRNIFYIMQLALFSECQSKL